jgi:hypothetical protein
MDRSEKAHYRGKVSDGQRLIFICTHRHTVQSAALQCARGYLDRIKATTTLTRDSDVITRRVKRLRTEPEIQV